MSIYDPEIDPTIREEEEEAQRLLEQERQREEQREELRTMLNDLLDEREARKAGKEAGEEAGEEADKRTTPAEGHEKESDDEKKSKRKGRKSNTAKEIISGGILTNPKVRRYYPYIFGGCLLLLVYMMAWFGSQRQQHTNQVLTRQLHKIRTEAIAISGEAKQASSRSAIAERIAKYKPELKESTKPVNVIEK